MVNHTTASYGFTLDRDRLDEAILAIYRAAEQRQGIFERDLGHFLPQWNLPPELEHSPKQQQPRDTYQSSLFLWTRLFCDRLSRSRHLMTTTLKTWKNPDSKWIFFPKQTIERTPEDIEKVLRDNLNFGLRNDGKEKPNGERYRDNAERILSTYDGDPRNLVKYKTVEEARAHLMKFDGIGTGLSNLFIMQVLEREVALPLDPENALLKIDRHKAGIPIYVGAIKPTNGEIDSNLVVPVLESEYRRICHQYGLDARLLDSALWITGSEVCAVKDYRSCQENCVLARSCISKVPISEETGRYQVTIDGKRVETRRERNNPGLFFLANGKS